MSLEPGRLIYGDGLDWRSQWDDQCVNLLYLDPPFNSNQDYNILYSDQGGDLAPFRAFAEPGRLRNPLTTGFQHFP